jgi:hypothetical protein
MKGAEGDRRYGFDSTAATENAAPSSAPASDADDDSSSRIGPVGSASPPTEVKSAPSAIDRPPRLASPAVTKSPPLVAKLPCRLHHVADRKRMRSRSRSTTMRVATLWTRPADRPCMTFFQRTGESS